METQQLIGKLLDETAQRDAIHIAVAPVVCGDGPGLERGEAVALDAQGFAIKGNQEGAIGIVDPFLEWKVSPGQRFFLFLYPKTAKSLRHVYEHPGLPPERAPTPKRRTSDTQDDPAKKAAARKWIEHLAVELGEPFETFDKLMAHATSCRFEDGEFFTEYDTEHKRDTFSHEEAMFWRHYETLTGKPVPSPDDYIQMFNCSC